MLTEEKIKEYCSQNHCQYKSTVLYNLNRYSTELNYQNGKFTIISYNDNGYCIEKIGSDCTEFDSFTENQSGIAFVKQNNRVLLEQAKYIISKLEKIEGVVNAVYTQCLNMDYVKILNREGELKYKETKLENIKFDVFINSKTGVRLYSYQLLQFDEDEIENVISEITQKLHCEDIDIQKNVKYPILFRNGSFGIVIHEVIGHLLEADFYNDYKLVIPNNENQVLDSLSVIDDCLENNHVVQMKLDDEGNE